MSPKCPSASPPVSLLYASSTYSIEGPCCHPCGQKYAGGFQKEWIGKYQPQGPQSRLTHQTHPCPLPCFTRRPWQVTCPIPRKEGKDTCGQESGPGALETAGTFVGHFSRTGRDSWVPAHPPALANNLLFVKVHLTKLLEPNPHSLSWIAATPSTHILCLRAGLLSTSYTKMYDPWFSIIGVN